MATLMNKNTRLGIIALALAGLAGLDPFRRCRECGRSDVPIEVHHVNGDPTDNRIANTTPLCVDCHRSTTFPGVG